MHAYRGIGGDYLRVLESTGLVAGSVRSISLVHLPGGILRALSKLCRVICWSITAILNELRLLGDRKFRF